MVSYLFRFHVQALSYKEDLKNCFCFSLGCVLHGCDVPHSHGSHSHAHDHDDNNINVRAALIHVLGDIVQSIGVFIAALIIKFKVNKCFLFVKMVFGCLFVYGSLAVFYDDLNNLTIDKKIK